MADNDKAMNFIFRYVPSMKKEVRKNFIREAQLAGIITEPERDHITAQFRASGML